MTQKEYKKREGSRRRQKLREDRRRQRSEKKKIQGKDVKELKDGRRDSKGRKQDSRTEMTTKDGERRQN